VKNPQFGLTYRVWSSASSSGEEPYTLAICLAEALSPHANRHYEVLGTDICETVLRHASTGIYEEEKVEPVPKNLLHKYFLRNQNLYKVKPELARHVMFKKMNLLHNFHHHLKNFDAVFCRNVLIYFDKKTQEEIVNKQWHVLRPGGYLCIGHSESITGMDTPYIYIEPSVYQRALE